jgi:hypothetical protein
VNGPGVLLQVAYTDWYCPNCKIEVSAPEPPPGQVKFHVCGSLHGLTAPLIRAGVRCKVEAEVRADYLGGEVQATGDDGRPYMAVRTTRDDGEDLIVNAGLAQARLGGYR